MLLFECHLCPRTLASSPVQELLSGASSDDCAHGGDMSSSRSLRPWPRTRTTPHEERGRAGPGRRRERDEVHGQVPDDSSSPAGVLQLVRRRARREAAFIGSSGAPRSSQPNLLPWCRSSTLLCRRQWISWWKCSGLSTPWCLSR